jgi:flagellar biogenesis protein FliO
MDKVTMIIFWASTILAVLLLVLVALYVLWKRKSGRKIGKYSTTSVLDKHFFFSS